MANYATIKGTINSNITQNGVGDITGLKLNTVLNAMVDALGVGCRFCGVVTPSSAITEPDGNVFYFATQGGTYANCGNVTVQDGVSVIKFENGNWGALQLIWYDTTPTQNSSHLVLSSGIWGMFQAQEERFRGVEEDMQELIGKIFDDSEVYTITKSLTGVSDTNSRQTMAKNKTYLNTLNANTNKVITDITVEMGGEDITKDVLQGPFSAEIIGHASGNEEDDLSNGDAYASGSITPDDGYGIAGISVEMGDDDITSSAVSGNAVSVPAVKGDVAVNVETACQVVETPFLHRVTGGGLTLANTKALIKAIKGNTLVWNQLVPTNATSSTSSNVVMTNNGDGSWTLSGISTHTNYSQKNIGSFSSIAGHKYYFRCAGATGDNKCYLKANGNGDRIGYDWGEIKTYSSSTTVNLYLVKHPAETNTITLWPMIIDLTKMFGAGNEPSTAAEFEALFPLSYYANDGGRLLNFTAEDLVSKDSSDNTLSTIELDITTLTGKVNGEGTSEVIFTDGMKSAGSVFDTVEKEGGKWYAKVNVGSVEINPANVTWSQWGTNRVYLYTFTAVNSADRCKATSSAANRVSGRMTIQASGSMAALADGAKGYVAINGNLIYITTADYNDRANLASFNINYELATPRTYLLTDEWQQILNSVYQVETGGMEIVLPVNDDEPETSPAKIEIQYGTNS